MEELLKEKMKWERELGLTDPTDPYCNACRQNLEAIELKLEAAKPKKTSKKSSKKSK
jgi:hypothetical protein